MNILQIISSSRTSGAEKHVMVLAQYLQKRGHTVTVVCPPDGWLPEQLDLAGIPTMRLPMRGKLAPKSVIAMSKFIKANKVDVVHTHLTRATYMGVIAGAIAKVPVISTVHVLTKDAAYRWLPRGNRHWVVAVSDFLRNGLLARGVSEQRVHTVYNGTEIDPDLVPSAAQNLEVRKELSIADDVVLVGQIGRVDEFKGAQLLVETVKSVVLSHPNIHFMFIGQAQPEFEQSLRQIAEDGHVSDHVTFLGVRNDVARLLGALDIVTLPSINEACSMAIIESMASGKPVIATRAGGNPELIDNGITGLLVERNSEALGAAILELATDREKSERMGTAASVRAKNTFIAPVMAKNMEEVYFRILDPK